MRKLTTLLVALFTLLPVCAYTQSGPAVRHRVLVVGTNTNSTFPGIGGDGYNGRNIIWLLNRLGFEVVTWATVHNFNAAETTMVHLNSCEAIFLCDVSVANHDVLMRAMQNYSGTSGIPLYVMAKSGATLSGDTYAVGATATVWSPGETACPLADSAFAGAVVDTLWLHGYYSSTHAKLFVVPDDSLGGSNTVTRLVWKYDEPDTTLMWRWKKVVTCGVASPPLGAWLLVRQFVADMKYKAYTDYLPLPLTFQLDADGITSSPFDGNSSLRWLDVANQVRRAGLKHLYFALFEGCLDAHCDSLISAWPQINNVFTISVHGPSATRIATQIWTELTSDADMQECYTNAWTGFHAKLSPKPDSTLGVLQCHRYAWSLPNAKFFLKKGVQVLNAMLYAPTPTNSYVEKSGLSKFMRFRPSGLDSGWVQIMPFANAMGADWNSYTDFYAYHTNRELTFGLMTSILANNYLYGRQFFCHVTSINSEAVVPYAYLPCVWVPFIRATSELWEFNDTPERLKQLAIRMPIGDGI